MSLFKKQEPEEVYITDKRLSCHVCSNGRFWRREGQLNTSTASFFGFDWANPSAVCIICSECGYIHWFMLGKKK
jgi:hypothetical protein